jgi:DNA adenine methylase
MAHPIVKWAGGKRRLIKEISSRLPKKIDTYYEPMFGGGAVFFALQENKRFKNAVISDINKELMITHTIVKNNIKKLIKRLQLMEKEFLSVMDKKDYYNKIREKDPEDQIEITARFIYLNHTCFNGLYRVNKSGKFNAPFGKYKKYNIVNENKLITAHHALQNTEIICESYEKVLKHMTNKDAAYIDPPYIPIDSTSFTTYTPGGFSLEDHRKLAKFIEKLGNKGRWILASNSDTELAWDLYDEFKVDIVLAPRSINSDGSGRGQVKELLISTRVK